MINISTNFLFSLQDMSIAFSTSRAIRPVISAVSINIAQGECIALVGESGSGKTITCLAALGLLREATISGRVFWNGTEFDLAMPSHMAPLRGRRIAMLPQNFSGAFNPLRTIGAQMADVIRYHQG